ncbi:MAG: hypothetical protein ACD_45C00229G0006 [uncultured bacterium]|nr:MAG: hypothetical protein ACD_45C00229G0006 [uncultured bacterium]
MLDRTSNTPYVSDEKLEAEEKYKKWARKAVEKQERFLTKYRKDYRAFLSSAEKILLSIIEMDKEKLPAIMTPFHSNAKPTISIIDYLDQLFRYGLNPINELPKQKTFPESAFYTTFVSMLIYLDRYRQRPKV